MASPEISASSLREDLKDQHGLALSEIGVEKLIGLMKEHNIAITPQKALKFAGNVTFLWHALFFLNQFFFNEVDIRKHFGDINFPINMRGASVVAVFSFSFFFRHIGNNKRKSCFLFSFFFFRNRSKSLRKR